jgi:hypothetical protein
MEKSNLTNLMLLRAPFSLLREKVLVGLMRCFADTKI